MDKAAYRPNNMASKSPALEYNPESHGYSVSATHLPFESAVPGPEFQSNWRPIARNPSKCGPVANGSDQKDN
eukprot:4900259-Amphidinium_carterae.1